MKEKELGSRSGSSYASSSYSNSGYGNSTYGNSTYGNYGNSNSGYRQNTYQDGNFGGFAWGPFGFGFGYEDFGGGQNSGQAQQNYSADTARRLQAAANYIHARHYEEATRLLNEMTDRPSRWYYYSALANTGLGNNINALSLAEQALAMEPNNREYFNLVNRLKGGESWYQNRGTQYRAPATSMSSICCTLCAIQMCCGGRMMFCC